jgi:hypothetical protein
VGRIWEKTGKEGEEMGKTFYFKQLKVNNTSLIEAR